MITKKALAIRAAKQTAVKPTVTPPPAPAPVLSETQKMWQAWLESKCPDGTPHTYQTLHSGRCYVERRCTKCGDTYELDSSD